MTEVMTAFTAGVTTITDQIYDIAEIAVPILIAVLIVKLSFRWYKRISSAG